MKTYPKKFPWNLQFFVNSWHWKKVMASQTIPPKVLLRNKAVWKTLLLNPCFVRFGLTMKKQPPSSRRQWTWIVWVTLKHNLKPWTLASWDQLMDRDGDVGMGMLECHQYGTCCFWYYSNTNSENEGNVPWKGTISKGKSTSKHHFSGARCWVWKDSQSLMVGARVEFGWLVVELISHIYIILVFTNVLLIN